MRKWERAYPGISDYTFERVRRRRANAGIRLSFSHCEKCLLISDTPLNARRLVVCLIFYSFIIKLNIPITWRKTNIVPNKFRSGAAGGGGCGCCCVCELSGATQPRRVRDNSFIKKLVWLAGLPLSAAFRPTFGPLSVRGWLSDSITWAKISGKHFKINAFCAARRELVICGENTLLFQRFQQLYLIRTHLAEVVPRCVHFYLFSSAKNCPIRGMERQVESSNAIETWNKEKLAFGGFPLDRADEIRRAPLLLVSFSDRKRWQTYLVLRRMKTSEPLTRNRKLF